MDDFGPLLGRAHLIANLESCAFGWVESSIPHIDPQRDDTSAQTKKLVILDPHIYPSGVPREKTLIVDSEIMVGIISEDL